MKIKLFSLIIAMITVIAILASCGGGGDTGNNGGNNGGNTGDNGNPGDNGDKPGNTGSMDWASTELTMQLNMNDSGKELSSGAKLYYTGTDYSGSQDVGNAVRARNSAAESAAKVTMRYTYVGENNNGYGWGGSIASIQDEVSLGGSTAPDMYVNFVYDMTCASIRNCFANVLDTDSAVYENGNYFRFLDADYDPTSDDYFDAEAGEGYFYQYMESLSLTPDTRIYCVASNYTLDLVRAFYVMPVNVTLMNGITDKGAPAGDPNNDGHDIQDFYAFVQREDNPWNYSALAAYANYYVGSGNPLNPNADIGDNVIGLAIGKGSGLTPSGILYTTDISLFNYNTAEGKYEYPSTPGKLGDLTSALYTLISNNRSSIAVVTTASLDKTSYAGLSELNAIRQKFAENGVLFGGVICVGALEDAVYQGMRTGDGFGVVPVPVYTAGEQYLTSVHNIARIAAISRASDAKSQCTAFLDYQSRNSAEILEDYYDGVLTAATGGVAGDANAKMLTYIRNHVRTCFDKTFEDVIANYCQGQGDTEAMHKRWAQKLADADYEISDISSIYNSLRDEKQIQLNTIYEAWLILSEAK